MGQKIGFLGLGRMGAGMAANLLKAGHEVTVYNRSAGKAEELVALGARRAGSPAEAAGGQEFVVTMLADDKAVSAVAFGEGIVTALPAGAVHISCSTISVELSEKLAAAHAAADQKYVAAPVFGRPDAAAAAKLNIVAAGAAEVLAACAPVFEAVGQRTFVMGERPAAANLVKLSGNFLIASVIESLGEAMALVAKGGVDKHAYLDMLTSTLFSAPVYKNYGAMIADGKFEPAGFAAALGLKDVRLGLSAADELQVPMPFASLLHDRFLSLVATGGGALDWAALGGLAARQSGQ